MICGSCQHRGARPNDCAALKLGLTPGWPRKGGVFQRGLGQPTIACPRHPVYGTAPLPARDGLTRGPREV